MKQAENGQLLDFLRHGVSNFLAGIFLIVTVLRFPTIGIDLKSAQVMSWIIGGVLILAAFSIIVAVFPVCKGYKGWIDKWAPRLLPVLYTISVVQLGINAIMFYANNLLLLLTITGIFLLVLLAAMIYMIKKRNILNYIPTLMLATLTFNTLSITLIFIEVSKWQIIPYAGIGILLLIRTILRYEKEHM
jgi:hypothetical protein